MNPEVERAIRTLDDLISWLAEKRVIKNQAALDRLTTALKVVAENCELDNAEFDAEVNAIAEKALKLKLLLRACGLTEKGIIELSDYPLDFLIEYVEYFMREDKALPLCFPITIEFMKAHGRIIKMFAEHEMNTNLTTEYPEASKRAFIYNYNKVLKGYQWI